MIIEGILFGFLVLAALLLYAWADGWWDWRRPDKGLIDLDVAPDIVAKQEITTDINYIKGKRK